MSVIKRGSRHIGGGAVGLNPTDLPAFLARYPSKTRKGMAGAILVGRDLALSTISCESHHDIADETSLSMKEELDGHEQMQRAETAETLSPKRLQVGLDFIDAEFWFPEKVAFAYGDRFERKPPATAAQLDSMRQAIAAHPAILQAYPQGVPEVTLVLWSPDQTRFTFNSHGLRDDNGHSWPIT